MIELIGQRLGKYAILSELGRGGMAVVFLARDTEMDRDVAVKILPREFTFERTFVERFQQEAKAIASLSHPHILPVFDYGQADGWTYIAMTHMPGGSLADRIRQRGNTYPLDQIAETISEIAGALDYAHSRNIIHRDFKPANVLLGDHDYVALSDFGIAKVTEATAQLTGSGIIGTPAYMAPEMSRKGGVTPLIDIYALGITLFQMITGELPFEADTPMGLLMAHANEPVPDVRQYRGDVPDDVQYVINRALSKNAATRYQKASDLSADLKAALAGTLVRQDGWDDLAGDAGTVGMTRPDMRGSRQTAAPSGIRVPLKPIHIVGGAAAVVAAIIIGALVVSGALTPPTADLPVTQPAADAPTNTAPTAVSLEPNARVLLGSADFRTSNSGDFQPLAGSETLAIGAAIRMGADGVGVLTFAPGVSVEVQPGAVVSIQRIEVVGDTLFVELTQESGTTYHFVGADAGGLKRDYMVHTPHGTIKAVGTEFWVDESPEGWYFIPADGTTTFAHNDSTEPADQYVEHAATGDCILVDASGNVTNCANLPGLTLLTDGSNLAVTTTPTAAVFFQPPTATACSEQYYCSKDPNMKGTLVHEKTDCTVELLPGNPQCAGDLGGGSTGGPGCGSCGSGGVQQTCDVGPATLALCGIGGTSPHIIKWDLCGECQNYHNMSCC